MKLHLRDLFDCRVQLLELIEDKSEWINQAVQKLGEVNVEAAGYAQKNGTVPPNYHEQVKVMSENIAKERAALIVHNKQVTAATNDLLRALCEVH